MTTPGQIQEVARHFIIAALWADSAEGTRPRVPARTHAAAFTICKRFIDAHLPLFNDAMCRSAEGYGSHPDAGSAEAAFGHDLWLTLRGHGAGFADRLELDRDDLGDRLSAACDRSPDRDPNFEQHGGWFYLYD